MNVKLDLDDGLNYIPQLEFLAGYPRTEQGIDGLSRAFVRIVGTDDKAEWLINQIIDGCNRCPAPIEMRRIFARKYPPADGKSPADCDNFDLMDSGRKM